MKVQGVAQQQITLTQVEAKPTRASKDEIRSAIAAAWKKATGHAASAGTVDILTAQSCLETASGTKMLNYNFAGIKGHGPTGMMATYGTFEIIDGKRVDIKDGFRAYGSLNEGADDYVALLRKRFPAAIAAAERGDVDGFAHGLKQAGYYTAAESDYAKALHSIAGIKSESHPVTMSQLTSAAQPVDAVAQLDTSLLSRVLDVVASSSARIAAPIED
jgi:flagellum-specific peptidoglycan hydrolase FlgJ